jgi:hypothetical protein
VEDLGKEIHLMLFCSFIQQYLGFLGGGVKPAVFFEKKITKKCTTERNNVVERKKRDKL